MQLKILAIVSFVIIFSGLSIYLYSASASPPAQAPVKETPQISHETRAVVKEVKKTENKRAEQVFKPISAPAPVPVKEAEIEPKLSWKEEQAIHRAEIERLEALKKNFPADSEEYREIEDKIYLELEEMGLTVYETENGGGINHTPNYEWIAEVSKEFDPDLQNQFAAEISAVEDLIDRRDEVDAEKRANRRGERVDSSELIEKDQRLVAEEFRFSRENPQFWDALNNQYEQVSD